MLFSLSIELEELMPVFTPKLFYIIVLHESIISFSSYLSMLITWKAFLLNVYESVRFYYFIKSIFVSSSLSQSFFKCYSIDPNILVNASRSSFKSLHCSDFTLILRDLGSLFIKASSPKWSPFYRHLIRTNPVFYPTLYSFKHSTSPDSII